MEMQHIAKEQPKSLADRTSVAEIMSTNVLCVTEDLGVDEVTQLFVDNGISGAPVVDRNGTAIGVVSKTDVVREAYEHVEADEEDTGPLRLYGAQGSVYDLGAGYHSVHVTGASVKDIMTPVAYTLQSSTSIAQAAALMAFEGIHRVPIVSDAEGHIVGVLSALDVLRWLGEQDGYLRHRPRRGDVALG